MSDAPQ